MWAKDTRTEEAAERIRHHSIQPGKDESCSARAPRKTGSTDSSFTWHSTAELGWVLSGQFHVRWSHLPVLYAHSPSIRRSSQDDRTAFSIYYCVADKATVVGVLDSRQPSRIRAVIRAALIRDWGPSSIASDNERPDLKVSAYRQSQRPHLKHHRKIPCETDINSLDAAALAD
jgi:hypothetical protein